jgi:hypothetical protein
VKNFTEIETYCYSLLHNGLSIKAFEAWVYESKELERKLSENDYLKIISIDYSKEEKSKYAAYDILKKYISIEKIETERILSLLYRALEAENDLPLILMEVYYLYCQGYYFFERLGLNYGLNCCIYPDQYGTWKDLTEQDREILANSLFPDVVDDINQTIELIESGKILLTGEKDQYGVYEYIDMRPPHVLNCTKI